MNGRLYTDFLAENITKRHEHVTLTRKFINEAVAALSAEQRVNGQYYSTHAFKVDDPILNNGYIAFTLNVKSSKIDIKAKRTQDGNYLLNWADYETQVSLPDQAIGFFYEVLVKHEQIITNLTLGINTN